MQPAVSDTASGHSGSTLPCSKLEVVQPKPKLADHIPRGLSRKRELTWVHVVHPAFQLQSSSFHMHMLRRVPCATKRMHAHRDGDVLRAQWHAALNFTYCWQQHILRED